MTVKEQFNRIEMNMFTVSIIKESIGYSFLAVINSFFSVSLKLDNFSF